MCLVMSTFLYSFRSALLMNATFFYFFSLILFNCLFSFFLLRLLIAQSALVCVHMQRQTNVSANLKNKERTKNDFECLCLALTHIRRGATKHFPTFFLALPKTVWIAAAAALFYDFVATRPRSLCTLCVHKANIFVFLEFWVLFFLLLLFLLNALNNWKFDIFLWN